MIGHPTRLMAPAETATPERAAAIAAARGWPEYFPGAWQNFPDAIKRAVRAMLLERALLVHDGPAGLLKWMYVGTDRPNGQPVGFTRQAEDVWRYVLEDADRFVAEQEARARQRSAGAAV